MKPNLWWNQEPMQIRKNRCDATELRFFGNHSSKNILYKLRASQIWNGCASQERIAEIKWWTNYCCSYGFRSLSSKRSPKVMQSTNMEKRSLACLRHLLIKAYGSVKVNIQIFNWFNKLDRRQRRPFQSTELQQQEVWIWGSERQWHQTWMDLDKDHCSKASHGLSECRIQLKQSEKTGLMSWYIYKLSAISILIEGHVILVWLIRIYDICYWLYEKDKEKRTENRARRHACEYGGERWGWRINFHKGWAVD